MSKLKSNTPEGFFVIIGPLDAALNQQYWDIAKWEWTTEIGAATHFMDNRILFYPLVRGCGSVVITVSV